MENCIMDDIKVGDIAIAKFNSSFVDGTKEEFGQVFLVTEETLFYYSYNSENYKFMKNR